MEHLLVRVLICHILLLLFDLPHQLLRLLVLGGHDVRDTQVGQDDATDLENVFEVVLHQGLVEAGRLLELVLLHEEHMGHIQLPDVLVVAKLYRLVEDLFHLRVVLVVPVDLRLLHQHRNKEIESVVVVSDGFLGRLFATVFALLLHSFGGLAQVLRQPRGHLIEGLVRFLGRLLSHNDRLDELVQKLVEVLVRQVYVFGQHVCSQVIVFVFDVEEQEGGECFGRKNILLQQEL